MTSSCHRCLGLPTGLVPIGFQSNSFPVGLARSILWIFHSHLTLCALMDLTISAARRNVQCYFLGQPGQSLPKRQFKNLESNPRAVHQCQTVPLIYRRPPEAV